MLRGVKDRDIGARELETLRSFRLGRHGIRAIIGERIRAVYRELAPFNLHLRRRKRRREGMCLLDLLKLFRPTFVSV